MAETKSGILGKIKGSVSNVVGRVRFGQNIISVKPSSFTPGNDPNSIARREKFRITVKFANAVVSIEDLKSSWKKIAPKGLFAFHIVVQNNYPYFANEIPSASNTISPPKGFIITSDPAQITQTAIQLAIHSIGNVAAFDTSVETNLRLSLVMALFNPQDPNVEKYEFVSFKSDKQSFQTTANLTFSIPLPASCQSLVSKYSSKIIYYALTTLDINDAAVNCSVTLSE